MASEASSSLASRLQPRWVVKAPAQDQSLRRFQGRNYSSEPPACPEFFPFFVNVLSAGQLLVGVPVFRSMHFG